MKNKGRFKKIIVMLTIVMLLLTIVPLGGIIAFADGVTITNFEIKPNIANKSTYWTGEQVIVNVEIDMSDTENILTNPTVTITIPSQFVPAVNASDMQLQTSKTVVTAGGNTTITYTFSQLTGGTTISIPIAIDNTAYSTPDGYVLPIAAEIRDSGGELIETASLNLTYDVTDFSLYKYINISSNSYSAANGSTAFGGFADPNNADLIDINGAAPVNFYFQVQPSTSTSNNSYGGRYYEEVVIVDTLPAGAVFLQTDNPAWSYDSLSGTVTRTITGRQTLYGNAGSGLMALLILRFPGQDVTQTYTNDAEMTFTQEDMADGESEIILDDAIDFKITNVEPNLARKYCNPSYIYDYLPSKQQDIVWTLSATNGNGATQNMEDIIIEDFDLDSRLKYTSIDLRNESSNFTGTVTIESFDAGNVTTVIAANTALNAAQSFPIPADAVKIVIRSDAGSFLLPGRNISFAIHTAFKDPENTHTAVSSAMNNSMNFSGEFIDSNLPRRNFNVNSTCVFYPYNPQVAVRKYDNRTDVLVNDIISYGLLVDNSSTEAYVHPSDNVDAKQVIDLLPPGFDYISSSAAVSYSADNPDALASAEPEIVHNYKGTGRTALIWTFTKPLTGNTDYFSIPGTFSYSYLEIRYDVKVTVQAEEGVNTNDAYFVYANNGESSDGVNSAITPQGAVSDDLELNVNGAETIPHASSPVNYIPPKEVVVTKAAEGNLDSGFSVAPGNGRTEIGSAINYNLKVTNYSLADVNAFTVIDVLPYSGDKNLVADGSGVYGDRDSVYPVALTGSVNAPPGYTVYYTQDLPASDMQTYASSASWLTTVTDYSSIKGIKIVMDAGTVLERQDSVTFTLHCENRADGTAEDGDMAYNSAAVSLNNINFFESTKIGARIHTYTVRGTLFKDLNENGVYDTGDDVFANHKVSLVDANGDPAENLSGDPLEVTTDANGQYEMTVYHSGEYSIKILPPTDYDLTEYTPNSPGVIGSNILDGGHVSDLMEIGPDAAEFTVNAGYYADYKVEYFANTTDVTGGTLPLVAEYKYQSTVTVADGITRTGYEWKGWNTNADGTGTVYAPEDTFEMPANNVQLYAVWQTNKYKVEYFANTTDETGGTLPADADHDYLSTVTVADGITRTGYEWKGWNTNADGTGTMYAPEDTFEMPAGDVQLYAIWETAKYKVRYFTNTTDDTGGTLPADADYNYGSTVTVADGITRTGYEWKGWNTNADGTGVMCVAGNTFEMPAGDVHLYAIWEKNAVIPTASPPTGDSENLFATCFALIVSTLVLFLFGKHRKSQKAH